MMQFNRIINYLFSMRLVTVGGNGIVLVLLSVAVIAFLNALQCSGGLPSFIFVGLYCDHDVKRCISIKWFACLIFSA